jgi:hypothetical protein
VRQPIEVEMEPLQPGTDRGVLVCRMVVDDQVEFPPGWGLAVDLEKADEFLVPGRAMHWPMTRTSSTSSAANNLVVPYRL